jgi:hypothetical protein
MVNIFSFSLFGNDRKYTRGLLENVKLITHKYPLWHIWIYLGDDVTSETKALYTSFVNVKLIEANVNGFLTKFFRYFPIDNKEVDICIIRDADSRVNDRDDACIKEFIESDKLYHIIRDHPNHKHLIMAGMWGIKKGCLTELIYDLFLKWKQANIIDFWSDTRFLVECIYNRVKSKCLIHDDLDYFKEGALQLPHKIEGNHFIGQVYEFNKDDREYPKFNI